MFATPGERPGVANILVGEQMRKLIIDSLKKYKLALLGCIGAILLQSCLSVSSAFLLGKAIDDLSDGFSSKVLLIISLYASAEIVLIVVANTLKIRYLKITGRISIDLQSQVVKKLFHEKGKFFSKMNLGDILEVLHGDISLFVGFVTDYVLAFSGTTIVLLSMLVYLAYLQWDLLIIVVLLQFLIIPFNKVFNPILFKKAEKKRENRGKVLSLTQEFLANIHSFSGNGLYDRYIKTYDDSLNSLLSSTIKLNRTANAHNVLNGIITVLVLAIILLVGNLKISAGVMKMGTLVIFIKNFSSVSKPILELVNLKTDIQELKPSVNRIIENIQCPKEDGKIEPENITTIEFKDVDFSYSDENTIIRNLNFEFNTGTIFSIEGRTGLGKSTLIDLLLGFWTPQKGQVLINKENLQNINHMSFRNKICYIPQEDFLLNASIRENVLLYRSDISDDDIFDALKAVCLDNYANEDMLNKNIGDSGINMSGGERRRLMLARALIDPSSVVILDEPTTGLDIETESIVMKAIRERLVNKMVIIISHSEQVRNYCDRNLVLEMGKLTDLNPAS